MYPVALGQSPWAPNANLGSFLDRTLFGGIYPTGGGWVTITFVGFTVHTIWGAAAGQILNRGNSANEKAGWLILAGLSCIVIGLALDPITPIAKRVCTSSYVFVSGGFCFLFLAGFYWVVDIKEYRKWAKPMVIVGLNSIFIYLFHSFGSPHLGDLLKPFTEWTRGYLGQWDSFIHVNLIFLLEMIVCYLLFRRNIFIKI
jgi:predicted acyltransferase